MKLTQLTAVSIAAMALVLAGCTAEDAAETTANETINAAEITSNEVMEKDGDAMEDDTHSGDVMEKDGDAMEKEDEPEVAEETDELIPQEPVADGEVMEKTDTDGEVMVKEEADGEVMEKEETVEPEEVMEKEVEAATPGQYIDYDESKLSLADSGDVVLFFHAGWCPSCRTLNSSIEANRADIPAGVTIMKVDYDNTTELRQKYGVTYQHTLVQVNANGDQITKWSGGNTLTSVTDKIQ